VVLVPVDCGVEEEMAWQRVFIVGGNGERELWRSICFLKCCTVEEYLHPLIDHIVLLIYCSAPIHVSVLWNGEVVAAGSLAVATGTGTGTGKAAAEAS
jgi:hypothetical protein